MESTVGRKGRLDYAFGESTKSGQSKTVIQRRFSCVPLQILKPQHTTNGEVLLYLLSPTGGVVQGDQYDLKLDLATNSQVIFTTQAATKVYAMPDSPADQALFLKVGTNARLEYLPDPLILFRASRFSQVIDVEIAPGGVFVFQDIILPGRVSRQEDFVFTSFSSSLRINDEHGLLFCDPVKISLNPASNQTNPDFHRLGLLEEFKCWGSFYVFGELATKGLTVESGNRYSPIFENIQSRLELVGNLKCNKGQRLAIGGFTYLKRNGLVIRMMAQNTQLIQNTFSQIWAELKQKLLKMSPIDLRKF